MNNSRIKDDLPINQEIESSAFYLKCQNFETSENISYENVEEIGNSNNSTLNNDMFTNQEVESSFNVRNRSYKTSENISHEKPKDINYNEELVEYNLLTDRCQNMEKCENIESLSLNLKYQNFENNEHVSHENLEEIGNLNNSRLNEDVSKNPENKNSSFNIKDVCLQTDRCQNVEKNENITSPSFNSECQNFETGEYVSCEKLEETGNINNSRLIGDMSKDREVENFSFDIENQNFQTSESISHQNFKEISNDEKLAECDLLTERCHNTEKHENICEENVKNLKNSEMSDETSNLFHETVNLMKENESVNKEFRIAEKDVEVAQSNLLSNKYQNFNKCNKYFEDKGENMESCTEFGPISNFLDGNSKLISEKELSENKDLQNAKNAELIESNCLSNACQYDEKSCKVFKEKHEKLETFNESSVLLNLLYENVMQKNNSMKNCIEFDEISNLLHKQFNLNIKGKFPENKEFRKSEKTAELVESNLLSVECQYMKKSDEFLEVKHGNAESSLASNSLNKNVTLHNESQLHKKRESQSSEKIFEKPSETVRNRLLEIQTPLIVCENILKEFLQITRYKLQLASVFKSEVEIVLKIKLLQAELMYRLIKKTTMEMVALVEDDYEGLCEKDDELFNSVIARCDEIDHEVHTIIFALLDL